MNLIKVAAAVLNQTPLAWEQNKANILEAIAQAKQQNTDVLCLPELCISGYGCEDSFYSLGVLKTSLEMLAEIMPHTKGIVVCLGLPLMFRNRIFNTACLAVDGEIVGFVAKRFLAGSGIHYEPRWFTPWPEGERVDITLNAPGVYDTPAMKGKTYPLGDLYFNVGGIKIGFEICEDAWVAGRPGRKLYARGVDLILNPSASHFAFEKLDIRKRFVLEGSRAFGTAYVYANLLGNEAGRAVYDGGALIASSGRLLAVGERLGFQDVLLTSAVVDISEARMAQSQASTIFNIPEVRDDCIEIEYSYKTTAFEISQPVQQKWETSEHIRQEEFARALALGLYDYMRKSRSSGFVVSLSGGADSSAISSLVYLMSVLGIESIGLEKFKSKMGYISGLEKLNTAEEFTNRLLTTAYQPTANSSDVTLNAAKGLAEALNAKFYEFDINNIVNEYVSIVSGSIGRKLTWETDDVTLQNIQARVRAPSVWMLANINSALLVSTSNRSEAAVGYATMDGDTAGGLSPIAGIDKAFLRKWLVWLEKTGVDGRICIPALRAVNVQQPTAELRPSESKQTDEDDLMPYDVLDSLEEAGIRDKKLPLECYLLMKLLYPAHSPAKLKEWTIKFFRLWCRNQWKRERYAPSFHLDDKNLDPKTWCRFPILSGGFQKEILELEAFEG